MTIGQGVSMLVSLFAGLLGVASAEEAPVTEEKDIFLFTHKTYEIFFVSSAAVAVLSFVYAAA